MPPEYTVTRLSTTPVKGLMLDHPDSIELTTQGAAGDRLFFLVDDEGGLQSCTRNPGLYGLSATYDAETRHLEVSRADEILHSGSVVAGVRVDTDMWGLRRLAGDLVADPTWSSFFSDLVGRRVQLVRARGSAFDVEPVTLLGTASVAELATRAGLTEVDSRRFRMLIEVDGGDPHVEAPGTGSCCRSAARSCASVVRSSAAWRRPGIPIRAWLTSRHCG
ncbi:MOSC N-terminal beta barrel domain-containing protein [Nocardioides sp. AX2bis]|uniref:MOSC N-terminal beta barrel domain-containing protein n=1 Tax=Nocardioides sp. AX2bis TaxID=2653157 RepID=UPI0012F2D1D3|nr:MOSC N-terminal beta barrel domain-containing protein [Nocardioides sp. AX2bis]VXC29017.1 conserved hypothetical protein [Nocardioides sp. AX2bis]